VPEQARNFSVVALKEMMRLMEEIAVEG